MHAQAIHTHGCTGCAHTPDHIHTRQVAASALKEQEQQAVDAAGSSGGSSSSSSSSSSEGGGSTPEASSSSSSSRTPIQDGIRRKLGEALEPTKCVLWRVVCRLGSVPRHFCMHLLPKEKEEERTTQAVNAAPKPTTYATLTPPSPSHSHLHPHLLTLTPQPPPPHSFPHLPQACGQG